MVRSRLVIIGLIGMLGVMLLTAGVVLISMHNVDTMQAMGPALFGGVTSWLRTVVNLGVTLYAGFRLMNERKDGGMDLLFGTTLKPRAILDGKAGAALALTALLLSATLPFMVQSVMLRGVGWGTVLSSMISLLVEEACLLYVAFMFAARGRRLMMILFCLLLMSMSSVIPMIRMVMHMRMSFLFSGSGISGPSALMTGLSLPVTYTIVYLAVCATICLLARAEAISTLSPPQSNRDLPFRLWMCACLLGWFIVAVIFGADAVLGFACVALGLLFLVLLREVSKPTHYSLRIRASIGGNGFGKLPQFLFFTGGINGVCWCLAAITLMLITFTTAISTLPSTSDDIGMLLTVMAFLCAPALLVRGVWYLGFSKKFSPRHLGGITFLLITVGLFGMIIRSINGGGEDPKEMLAALSALLFLGGMGACLPEIIVSVAAFRPLEVEENCE